MLQHRASRVWVVGLVALVALPVASLYAAKVKKPPQELKFVVPSDCKITTNERRNAKLDDLQLGMKVNILCETTDGVLTAQRIVEVKPPKPPGEGKGHAGAGKADHKAAKPDDEQRAHGIINTLDPAGKTVTIIGKITAPKPEPANPPK